MPTERRAPMARWVMSWQTPLRCSQASAAVVCTPVTPGHVLDAVADRRGRSRAPRRTASPRSATISRASSTTSSRRPGARRLPELLDELGGALDLVGERLPVEPDLRMRARAHLDEARRRQRELAVRREHLERRDPRAPVVDVVVLARDREDLDVGGEHELSVGAGRQHPGLVVRRGHLAVVVEARDVPTRSRFTSPPPPSSARRWSGSSADGSPRSRRSSRAAPRPCGAAGRR